MAYKRVTKDCIKDFIKIYESVQAKGECAYLMLDKVEKVVKINKSEYDRTPNDIALISRREVEEAYMKRKQLRGYTKATLIDEIYTIAKLNYGKRMEEIVAEEDLHKNKRLNKQKVATYLNAKFNEIHKRVYNNEIFTESEAVVEDGKLYVYLNTNAYVDDHDHISDKYYWASESGDAEDIVARNVYLNPFRKKLTNLKYKSYVKVVSSKSGVDSVDKGWEVGYYTKLLITAKNMGQVQELVNTIYGLSYNVNSTRGR